MGDLFTFLTGGLPYFFLTAGRFAFLMDDLCTFLEEGRVNCDVCRQGISSGKVDLR